MLKLIIYVLIILLILFLFYIYIFQPLSKTNQLNQPANIPSSKPVVMIIVDSLMDEPLQKSIKDGKTPALKFLIDHGKYYPDMISSYPTMSVSIEGSLLTGTYPDEHRVPALVWYDENKKQFISYGSARKEIMKLGIKEVLRNSVFKLNQEHLSNQVKTLHEEVEQSASINALIYRGNNTKPLQVPRLFNMMNYMDRNASVKAPDYFSFGLLSTIDPRNNYTYLWQSFGLNDKFAAKELKYLINQDRVPSFSLVFFPENDKAVHKMGTSDKKGIEKADQQLQEIFNTYPTWEDALRDIVWVVMGDSGQTDVINDESQALIDLRELLSDYQIHQISKPIQVKDEIVLGLNERMSFVYLLDEEITFEEVASKLNHDERIGFTAWKDGEWVHVLSGDGEGQLTFKPDGEYKDSYNQTWTLEGNPNVLDLSINEKNEISYDRYPDGLARLYSSLHSHSGKYLIVDAKPGYEFVGEGSPTHVGGASHGSLHKQDAYFPLIVTGTDLEPKHKRIIDLKEWIMQIIEKNNE
ncbi:alkaline phosphatase family protein [Piscibacillus halophilus]|uniref:Predicted pyrophosphatase or phosphodiesterase, AlkP superfamily n=1 Tax=Piscibacillus halophilus TaxID=571933 RepID=A0A1H9ERD6_9BACI|nr:alkaline phosphatase family protein [Piscibacillus halophilus]SEQ27568.1 Predicted pyrophosphatase or phosphodiesterase, AlkP superfamily [Piscibacillus halophilus]